jgi:hypothetical protein
MGFASVLFCLNLWQLVLLNDYVAIFNVKNIHVGPKTTTQACNFVGIPKSEVC